jgi:hypothetical protein
LGSSSGDELVLSDIYKVLTNAVELAVLSALSRQLL